MGNEWNIEAQSATQSKSINARNACCAAKVHDMRGKAKSPPRVKHTFDYRSTLHSMRGKVNRGNNGLDVCNVPVYTRRVDCGNVARNTEAAWTLWVTRQLDRHAVHALEQ